MKSAVILFAAVFWLGYGVARITQDFNRSLKKFMLLKKFSLEDRRALLAGPAFYFFLKYCDSVIPAGKTIKWVFPEGRYMGNDEYYFYKAYYYLYPRKYSDSANYIIVFGRKNYRIPVGFRQSAAFGDNVFILEKYKG